MKKDNILLLNRNEIDIAKYNICIDESKNFLPYAFSFYLDALCEDWSVLMLDNYTIVMPLPIRKKYGISYIYPPFFIQQLGIFSKLEINIEMVRAFIASVPEKFSFIQTNFNYANPPLEQGTKKMNLVLTLDQSYETIKKNYSKTLLRNVNKKTQTPMTFEESFEKILFLEFFEKHTLSKAKMVKKRDIANLSRLVDVLLEKKIAKLFVAKSGSTWLSATLFLITQERIINLLVANSDDSKETNSSAKLLDHVICLFADTKLTFDFEGSELAGVARFYQSFGAKEQPYFQYTENKLPSILKWLKN